MRTSVKSLKHLYKVHRVLPVSNSPAILTTSPPHIGKFKGAEKMVTSRIILEDTVEKGFKEQITRKDDHIKILVTPKRENLASA